MARQRARGRLTTVVLTVLSVGLPLGVALLDAREPPVAAGVESHHEPGRCSWHHDHAACVQLAQPFAAPTAGHAGLVPPPRTARAARRPSLARPPAPPTTSHHPRAPPLPIL